MKRWTATWRASELDYLIGCGDTVPLIVVRPRGTSEEALAQASTYADFIVGELNAREELIEALAGKAVL